MNVGTSTRYAKNSVVIDRGENPTINQLITFARSINAVLLDTPERIIVHDLNTDGEKPRDELYDVAALLQQAEHGSAYQKFNSQLG